MSFKSLSVKFELQNIAMKVKQFEILVCSAQQITEISLIKIQKRIITAQNAQKKRLSAQQTLQTLKQNVVEAARKREQLWQKMAMLSTYTAQLTLCATDNGSSRVQFLQFILQHIIE